MEDRAREAQKTMNERAELKLESPGQKERWCGSSGGNAWEQLAS